MIKGVAFDMDGVMFDTERLTAEAWGAAGEQMGYTVPEELVLKPLGMNLACTREIFLRHFGREFDFDAFNDRKNAYVAASVEKNGMPLKPGLMELLDYLQSRRYAMTVATSTDRNIVSYYFEKAGISRYFPEIVCGDSVEHSKPAPDIYLKACEILRLAPFECFALEDSPNGIRSACGAGMKPVLIPDLVEPDEEIRNMAYAEVPSLFAVIELLRRQDENEL